MNTKRKYLHLFNSVECPQIISLSQFSYMNKSRIIASTYLLLTMLLPIILLYICGYGWIFTDKRLPLSEGDFYVHGMQIKTILEGAWLPLQNSLLGAPLEQKIYEFQGADLSFFLTVKLLSVFTSDWMLIAKIMFICSFQLITTISFYAIKKIHATDEWALGGALIFAFLPFHFLRLPHLWLSMYISVPLCFMLCANIFNISCTKPLTR